MTKPSKPAEPGIASLQSLKEAEADRKKRQKEMSNALRKSGSNLQAIPDIDPKAPVTLVDRPRAK